MKGLIAGGVGMATAQFGLNVAHAEASVDCRILMIHEASSALVDNLISANRRAGRFPVTINQLTKIIMGDQPLPDSPLFAITFDDSLLSQHVYALPVLERWKVPATFFVIGKDWVDGVHRYMSAEQRIEITQKGHEIGSHTLNHDPNLATLRIRDLDAYLQEVQGSKWVIEDLIQKDVTSFCSPISVYNQEIIGDVMSSGYTAAVSTALDQKHVATRRGKDNLYQLDRERVS